MPTTSDFHGTERFAVVRRIGAGGMGVVYEVFDRGREARVALKFLPKAEPAALLRFKQEFRTVADITHRNLVGLYELFSDHDQWFFTMELVKGVDFRTYIREPRCGQPAPTLDGRSFHSEVPTASMTGADAKHDRTWTNLPGPSGGEELTHEQIERLRAALRQLVEGVSALHQLGMLHRDIKPTNVLITSEPRVVLLDFGLAAEFQPRRDRPADVFDIVGTVPYMSPEQAERRPLSPASDWYNVGAMLYEVLTGRRPFSGSITDVMQAKKACDPPDPRCLAPGIPEDLRELCVALLQRDPAERPDAARILRHCGPAISASADVMAERARRSQAGEFVGRRDQLAEMMRAYHRTRRGTTSVVFVCGESGVGKSALVNHFLEELPHRPEPVILSGRCYEQESMPFKAFDNLIDALTRYLSSLPDVEAAALLPRDISALVRIFPVVERVSVVAKAPARRAEVPDQRELRRRAFAALRELLARIADRSPLILAIDDLQWGDVDSALLIKEMLTPPDAPLLLLVATYRQEDAERSACLQLLDRTPGDSRILLSLPPLTRDESIELAERLLASDDLDARAEAEQIVRESQGSPLFVRELAQHVRDGIRQRSSADPAGSEPADGGRIRLDDALWRRIATLPAHEHAVLDVVSVAGRPLRPADAFAAAAAGGPGVLARLRTDRFIRVTGCGPDELLAPYHDRIHETVVARLSAEALRHLHRQLATVARAGAKPDPRILATHWEGAGEAELAGQYYAAAADEAAQALAFDQAADLYRKSLVLRPLAGSPRCEHLRRLADALANAGRGSEAARQYAAAADEAHDDEALALRGQAGFQFCAAGDIDAGRAELSHVLEKLSIQLPQTRGRALWSLLANRARLRLRGIRFRERRAEQVPAAQRTRIDVTWLVAVGLTMIDTIRGADFQTRNLLLALRTGEPYRIARSLAWEATHVAMRGVAGRRRTQRMLTAAGQLAERLGHPHALGMATMGRGVSAFFLGDWRESLEVCDRAAAVFTERCTGVAWELDTSKAFAFWSLFWLGRFGEIQVRFPRLMADADGRGDRLAAANFTTFGGPFAFLSRDDPDAAADALRNVMGDWSRQDFHVQHFTALSAQTYIELYRGRAGDAWQNLVRQWPSLEASLLLEVECVRIFMWHLRACCALAAAQETAASGGPTAALEREAARALRRLKREKPRWCHPLASTLRAALLARAGRCEAAADLLAGAISLLEAHDMGIYAAAARYRRGELIGGTGGAELIEQAAEQMREERILRPERVVGLFVPGA